MSAILSPEATNPTTTTHRYQTLADYAQTTGRLPRQVGGDTEFEIAAGRELKAVRVRRARGTLDAELTDWLNENVPGWAEENTRPATRKMRGRRTWEIQTKRLQRFVKATGRLPSPTACERSERELGIFLTNVRQAAKGKGTITFTSARRATLNRIAPGWDRVAA